MNNMILPGLVKESDRAITHAVYSDFQIKNQLGTKLFTFSLIDQDIHDDIWNHLDRWLED